MHAAVTDERRLVDLAFPDGNQGGTYVLDTDRPVRGRGEDVPAAYADRVTWVRSVLLDDLTELLADEVGAVLLKMDVEGYEARALRHADRLFNRVRVPFVLMEWAIMKQRPADHVEPMLGWLESRGYQVFDIRTLRRLPMFDWERWPDDVCFKHVQAAFEP